MKILFVQKMAAISGSELYLMHFLPELKRRGFDVKVLIVYPSIPSGTKPFVEHFRCYSIPVFEFYGYSTFSPFLLFRIQKLLKKEKFDLIQSNLVHADFWMALQKLLFFHSMRLISVKHGFDEAYSAKYGNDPKYLKRYLFFWVQRFSSFFIDYTVTISQGLYDMYVHGNITDPLKIKRIYYGFNLNPRHSPAADFILPENYAVIVGRLVEYKGHELLLKSWIAVKKANPSLKLLILGSGKYEKELLKLHQEYELTDVVYFLGHVPNPHHVINNARFTLMTSKWEGFGMVLLESWLNKKAIVGFDVPAINELVTDGVDGVLVKPFEIDSLSAAILKRFEDVTGTSMMGEKGFSKLIEYFSVNRMTDEMVTVYDNVLLKNGQYA